MAEQVHLPQLQALLFPMQAAAVGQLRQVRAVRERQVAEMVQFQVDVQQQTVLQIAAAAAVELIAVQLVLVALEL
jgi:hypothetical protein